MTWAPLAHGFLTGKYDDGVPMYTRAARKVSARSLGSMHSMSMTRIFDEVCCKLSLSDNFNML